MESDDLVVVHKDGHDIECSKAELLSGPNAADIVAELQDIQWMLLFNNRRYGNSALDPLRIFSRADPIEAINIRLDDKLSRLSERGAGVELEDVERDALGYLVLKRVARRILGRPAIPARSCLTDVQIEALERVADHIDAMSASRDDAVTIHRILAGESTK